MKYILGMGDCDVTLSPLNKQMSFDSILSGRCWWRSGSLSVFTSIRSARFNRSLVVPGVHHQVSTKALVYELSHTIAGVNAWRLLCCLWMAGERTSPVFAC